MPVPKCCQQNALSVSSQSIFWEPGTRAPSGLPSSAGRVKWLSYLPPPFAAVSLHSPLGSRIKGPFCKANPTRGERTYLHRIGIEWLSDHTGCSRTDAITPGHSGLTPKTLQTSWKCRLQICSMRSLLLLQFMDEETDFPSHGSQSGQHYQHTHTHTHTHTHPHKGCLKQWLSHCLKICGSPLGLSPYGRCARNL
jgi:hypothetical protein